MRISDWSSDVCSSDLLALQPDQRIRLVDLMLRDKDLQAGRRDLVQHAGCVEVGYRKIVEIEFGPVLDGDFRHPSHLIRLEICAGALLLFQCQLTGFDELVDDREARDRKSTRLNSSH